MADKGLAARAAEERQPGDPLSVGILSDGGVRDGLGSINALITALACAHAGIADITVYHSRNQNTLENSVELSPNATRILRALGLLDAVRALGFEPQFLHERSYRTGFQLATLALGAMAEGRYGAPFLHASARALTTLLTSQAQTQGIALQECPSLERISQSAAGITLETTDGARHSHHVLVVANDPDQHFRRLTRAEPLQSAPAAHRVWIGRVSRTDLPGGAFGNVVTRWLGPTQHFRYHYCSDEELEFQAFVARASNETDLIATFATWHPSLTALLQRASGLGQLTLPQPHGAERLAHGNLVFLGASCHNLPPHLAQQEALGMEDGWVLARLLEQWEDDPAEGLVEFERYRLPRARQLQAQGEKQVRELTESHRGQVWQRNLALTFGSRFLPELAMQKNDWLYGYDAVNGFE